MMRLSSNVHFTIRASTISQKYEALSERPERKWINLRSDSDSYHFAANDIVQRLGIAAD